MHPPDRISTDLSSSSSRLSGTLEWRCHCGKLLFKGVLLLGIIEVKCTRCKRIVYLQEHNTYIMEGKSGMGLIDLEGVIISANEGIVSILGFLAEELIGKSIYDFINFDHVKDIRSWLHKKASPDQRGSAQARLSLPILTKRGEYVDIFSFIKIIELNNRRFAMVILECQR